MMFRAVSNSTSIVGVIFKENSEGKLDWYREYTRLMVWRGEWIDLNPQPLLFFRSPDDQLGSEITFV